jgi:type II secretory pathway component PulF
MSTYSYKATDSTGKLVTGTLEAAEEKEAVASLQSMRYIPIRITLAQRTRIGPDIDLSKRVACFL